MCYRFTGPQMGELVMDGIVVGGSYGASYFEREDR
jgi:hypothetical protein